MFNVPVIKSQTSFLPNHSHRSHPTNLVFGYKGTPFQRNMQYLKISKYAFFVYCR